MSTTLDSPIPLSDIESILAWVDTFKLSRPTRKINRDFSDAVLLAEILSVHYPKLVEMHNYPPRNSHALKLNNWMTLNRKVLKKLRLNLCCSTMEQLANSALGVIERVLLMVRDRIRRDEELNKSIKDSEQNVSSGGSYYEACGDDDNVLVVPIKTRVNGVLETVQQKVVSYEYYQTLKEELKDVKESTELLKQKVEHLDDLLKLKEERIEELQKQLERKQTRRKEAEAYQNSLAVPFETIQSPVVTDVLPLSRKSSVKTIESNSKLPREESKIPIPREESKIPIPREESKISILKEESKIPVLKTESSNLKTLSKPSITEVLSSDMLNNQVTPIDVVKSDVFQDIKNYEDKPLDEDKQNVEPKGVESQEGQQINNVENEERSPPDSLEVEEFKDSSDNITTIEASIKNEIKDIIAPSYNSTDLNYVM
ncbi:unnamed protein product [Chilo suppressalis]|uniref:Calponin-homology (CH) domain-containing protein n=1 Tax=Chilo suppressalis TaxID=168631 RepID=A0ABN8AZ32_CHISP|nr:unnamed protein product [Chilo suppressalis]